ncbi:MAG TPA: DUF1015 domain-containing protein [Candidatus Acidoferrales bacterium]|nr:DUF1015 domain-containing protein [Candidatus Acidoferrales bacterium]
MAEIQPFRAFRYNTDRVALKDVLTQPYDKISPAMQERYYAASPANLIAIEKGKVFEGDTPQNNVYTRAAAKLEEWIAEKILVRDAAPSVYIYSQEYFVPGGHSRRERIGFIALGRLEDYDAKIVFRHERTLSAPKADRMELLRHTRAQTGQLFMLYDDPTRRIEGLLEETAHKSAPLELRDEYEVLHRLWPVSDQAFARRIQKEMAEKKLVIADGHHRYETALNYRNECRAQSARTKAGKTNPAAAYEFAMMTFINSHSKGLTILPTHRLVRNLADFNFERFRKAVGAFFDWYSYPFQNAEERAATYAEFQRDLEGRSRERRSIGIYPGGIYPGSDPASGAFYLFLLRRDAELETLLPDLSEAQRQLDVVLLHRLILDKGLGITAEAVTAEKNLSYEREMDAAIAAVDKGDAQLACLLNPVRVQQVMDIALGGDVLPQKSTDFYPKMLSGVAIYRVEGSVESGAEQPR